MSLGTGWLRFSHLDFLEDPIDGTNLIIRWNAAAIVVIVRSEADNEHWRADL